MAFSSYRSTSGQIFDSIVFNDPLSIQSLKNSQEAEDALSDLDQCVARISNEQRNRKSKLSVAAILAHRTRQMAA
jgi:hypothetical protein